MSLKKTYFLAPARHSTPLGTIALGNIIEDPRQPEIAINDPTSATVRRLAAKATCIDETNTFSYLAEGRNAKASVMAKVLEGFGDIGGGAGLARSNDMSSIYKIEKMTTQTVSPTLQEVKTIFNESSVQSTLRRRLFRSSVYMIISIRVVYGAEAFASTVRAAGGFLHFTADLTATGVPVNIGTALEAAKSNGQIMSTQVSNKTPFVLAYRLREIVFKRKEVVGQKEVEGEMLHAHGHLEQVREDMSKYFADVMSLEEEDLTLPECLGIPTVVGKDTDGSRLQIAVPA